MRISELHVFPIKGAAGVALTRTTLDAFGMADDRRWMIVDDRGVFVSQREYPELALLRVQLQPDELVIRSTRAGEARLPRQGGPGPTVRVRVWGDTVDAIDAGDVAAHTISAHLGSSVRLVHMPDSSVRGVDPDYGRASDRVSFADAFPLLLICQESLNTLNARLAEAIPMLRFRPNVVAPHPPRQRRVRRRQAVLPLRRDDRRSGHGHARQRTIAYAGVVPRVESEGLVRAEPHPPAAGRDRRR
jgi:uncharacterized protein YcbX